MKLLIDSDFLFGLFVPNDAHHQEASKLWINLVGQANDFFVTNLVVQETATVLNYKRSQATAIEFLNKLPELGLNLIEFDNKLETEAWKIFKKLSKKGTSFMDCSNLSVIEFYKLDGILAFDDFYPKQLRLK